MMKWEKRQTKKIGPLNDAPRKMKYDGRGGGVFDQNGVLFSPQERVNDEMSGNANKKKNRSLLNSASGNKKHDTRGVDEFDENGDLYSPLESINDEM